jgi:hypothetical protein
MINTIWESDLKDKILKYAKINNSTNRANNVFEGDFIKQELIDGIQNHSSTIRKQQKIVCRPLFVSILASYPDYTLINSILAPTAVIHKERFYLTMNTKSLTGLIEERLVPMD